MLQLEVLIRELGSINGLSASTITLGKVTTLDHKVLDDTMERGALVTEALLASSESPEYIRIWRWR